MLILFTVTAFLLSHKPMLNNAMLSKKAVSHFYTISTQILPKINLGSKSTSLNITVSRNRERL